MLISLLLLVSVAAGQDAGVQGPVQPGETITVSEKSWVLPDSYYTSCLENAEAAPIYAKRLDVCTAQGTEVIDQAQAALAFSRSALDVAQTQFDTDGEAYNTCLLGRMEDLRTQDDLEERLQRMRTQRNTAYLVTAVVLTAVSVGIGISR